MFKLISRFTWELPQTLLGLILFSFIRLVDKKSKSVMYNSVLFTDTIGFGISLGFFTFGTREEIYRIYNYPNPQQAALNTKNHEYGHSFQSRYLGPLYLILVGIPSVFFNLLTQYKVLKRETYYTRYPENWADKLGKVTR